MNNLAEIIKNEIKKTGSIPFSRFMELCLYHPTYGYYRKNYLPIGKYGDYYTSPTVHKFFGFLVARQIMEIIKNIDSKHVTLVEAGAGKGHLARDIGEYFKNNGKTLSDKLNLIIIEPHKPYREIQFKETKGFFNSIDFVDSPEELPNIEGVFYSNELFDSFPVEIIEFDGRDMFQIFVSYEDSRFFEIKKDLTQELLKIFEKFQINFTEALRTEFSPQALKFYEDIAKKIDTGGILTIDYGYTNEEFFSQTRNRGTLMCYYRHNVSEDPFIRIGEQDLTAHVNFSLLKQIGEYEGFQTSGYTKQQYFLMGCGFMEEAEHLKALTTQQEFEDEMRKIKVLLIPGGMGTTFKVLFQSKGVSIKNPCGFSFKNYVTKL